MQGSFILQKSFSEKGQNPEHWNHQLLLDWSQRNAQSLLVGMQNSASTVEGSMAASYKAKHGLTLPSSLAYHPLGIYPEEPKTYVHTKTCTWMFIPALPVTAKTWKQPRCPSVGDGEVSWYIQHWNITQCKKELSSEAMKSHGGTLNVYY